MPSTFGKTGHDLTYHLKFLESSCIASNLSVPSSIFDLNNASLASPRCHNSTLIQQNGSSSHSNLNTYSQGNNL